MPFDERWLFPMVGALVTLSALVDLIGGRVRLRGMGVFRRDAEPRSFWCALGAKTAFAVVLFAIGYARLAF